MRLAAAILPIGVHLHPEAIQAKMEGMNRARKLLSIHGFKQTAVHKMVSRAADQFDAYAGLCESPIELIMLSALGFMHVEKASCYPVAMHDAMSGEEWPRSPVVIIPQFVIARYRLDFLVHISLPNAKRMIAIECDGKDFHTDLRDRKNDAARDCYLAAIGIHTLRYSGSWIRKNYLRVADEINATLDLEIAKHV